MKFSKRYRYRFGDCDDAGIAYYPKFFHYFHCAFEDWWSEGLGIDYPAILHDEKLGMPVAHAECEFLHPVRFGDEPTIHMGILEIGTKSVKFGYWMTLDGVKGPACRARVTTVVTDMSTLESQPVPDRWRTLFEEFRITEDELQAG